MLLEFGALLAQHADHFIEAARQELHLVAGLAVPDGPQLTLAHRHQALLEGFNRLDEQPYGHLHDQRGNPQRHTQQQGALAQAQRSVQVVISHHHRH